MAWQQQQQPETAVENERDKPDRESEARVITQERVVGGVMHQQQRVPRMIDKRAVMERKPTKKRDDQQGNRSSASR